jgi:hypothetical protein
MIESKEDRRQLQLALCGMWQLMTPGAEMPIETQRAYLMALEDLDIKQVHSAIYRLMRTSKFFPKPVEIRELCGDSSDAEIQAAWKELQQALDRFGSVDVVTFANPVLAATVKAMGGLVVLAQMPLKEFNSFGWHRFKEAYNGLRNSASNTNAIEFRTLRKTLNAQPKQLAIGGPSERPRLTTEFNGLIKRP